MTRNRRHILVLLIYLAFFSLLFLQYPLKNCLPGNYDAWMQLVMWKTLLTKLQSLFSGEFLGTFFYPAENVFYYGETSLITTAIFGACKILGASDLWCCYWMIVLVFGGAAWGVYILAGNYTKDAGGAFFAGFAYACSNFLFGGIDDAPIYCALTTGLALHFFLKYIHENQPKHLVWMAVIGGLEAYVSVYAFVLQSAALVLFALVYVRSWASWGKVKIIAPRVLLYGLVPLPLIAFYLYAKAYGNVYFPWPVHLVMDGTSLRPWSLFGVLPGNLLYPATTSDYVVWSHVRIMAFVGFGLWLLALLGLIKAKGRKIELVLLALFGLAFSFAVKDLNVLGDVYRLPFYYTGDDSLLNFFRVPSRFFILTSMALSILGGMGLSVVRQWFASPLMKRAVLAAFLIFHCLENTPFPLAAYPMGPMGDPPVEYKEYFQGMDDAVILDLPSTDIAVVPFEDDYLFGFNREFIYMHWQLDHRRHILNGINGYAPSFRVYFEGLTDKVFYEGNLEAFDKFRPYKLSHVVFHKDLVLKKDKGMEERLKTMPFLELKMETPRLCIFRVLPKEDAPRRDKTVNRD
ncbi:hypothetical protein Dalk_4754 [Desulfatibacillum aliphaticivorans]|uniref:Glycosyltransferase RgtA/B/C/D-like domain-containing protein n=1 Tax=Desulfatibacillum aliphaticivorans TaxID=218208 RepID=B8FD01_DESAL|nr:hypothetical protein [Desulfatibacillum aliphaticivorans]ACL06432.1 hypothetical protein Dalk_4754 [Desulfatibacillum aliphaticivorans]